MSKLKILIVDDDISFRKISEIRLKSFLPESEFFIVGSVAEARELIRTTTTCLFDFVMLDRHLPDGTGTVLLEEGLLSGLAVLAVSSDDDPEIPAQSILAGAAYFLGKNSISEALFKPLVLALIERNKLQREMDKLKAQETRLQTVSTLVGTLKHEINNPLGAVLGAAFILKSSVEQGSTEAEAARLVEESGRRIKQVLDKLCDTVELEAVVKADQEVFHIPGDAPWEGKK